jgi:hypothetical protein
VGRVVDRALELELQPNLRRRAPPDLS